MVLDADSPNSDQDYPAGSTTRVYVPISTATHNDMINGILVHADQDGTLKAGAVDDYDVMGTEAKRYTSSEYAPQGFMQNGKIATSVATNDLTVAIKTLAGADPSASDPVIVRIGNTSRTITSALSITKTDGTNWFNSGRTGLATNEVDYFVYLGYNATDGVTIGFARIPYARVYGDFSTTNTNDKYCAISTITNAVSTDEYEVVGRFNAILSGTAAFQWSLPATSIIINRPIYSTRQLTMTPEWTSTGTQPAIGNGTYTLKYCIENDSLSMRLKFVGGSTTTWGTGTYYTELPITAYTGVATDDAFSLSGYGENSGVTAYNVCGARFVGSTSKFYVIINAPQDTVANVFGQTTPFTWGTGDFWSATAFLPIS